MFKHKSNMDRYSFLQAERKTRHRPCRRGPPRRPTAGFTLVELLVVITIIGILMGLTMPAIMSAIETARLASCKNNMKQIGLAVTTYETSLRQYPLNWGQVSTVGQPSGSLNLGVNGVSWLTALLPNIDQMPLYKELSLGMPLGYTAGGGYDNSQGLSTIVSTYVCPSDTSRGSIMNATLGTGTYATTNYKSVAGSNWQWVLTGTTPPWYPNWPVGRNSGNSDGIDHGNGVICRGGGTGVDANNNPCGARS